MAAASWSIWEAAGLDGTRITAHSLRAGHATTAALAGVPLNRIAADRPMRVRRVQRRGHRTRLSRQLPGSDSDGDLAADLPGLQTTHGLWCVLERVAPVQSGHDFACLDQLGELLQVGGSLLGQEQLETFTHER